MPYHKQSGLQLRSQDGQSDPLQNGMCEKLSVESKVPAGPHDMLDSGDNVLTKHTLSETRRLVPDTLSDVNDKGHVANEVEIEQIASELLVLSFHISNSLGKSSDYTSYVQIRGSIPLHWAQYTANMSPRPSVEGAKQFNGLLERYGSPVVVVNLIKGKEHVARERKLLKAYAECAVYLNHFLPLHDTKKIRYIAWHMGELVEFVDVTSSTDHSSCCLPASASN